MTWKIRPMWLQCWRWTGSAKSLRSWRFVSKRHRFFNQVLNWKLCCLEYFALVEVVAAVGMMCIWWYNRLSRNVLICKGSWSNCIISCNDHWCEENTICSRSFIQIFLLNKVTTGLSHCMNYVGALWYICTRTLHVYYRHGEVVGKLNNAMPFWYDFHILIWKYLKRRIMAQHQVPY